MPIFGQKGSKKGPFWSNIREPQKIPLVISTDEAKRLLAVAKTLRLRVLLSLAYGSVLVVRSSSDQMGAGRNLKHELITGAGWRLLAGRPVGKAPFRPPLGHRP